MSRLSRKLTQRYFCLASFSWIARKTGLLCGKLYFFVVFMSFSRHLLLVTMSYIVARKTETYCHSYYESSLFISCQAKIAPLTLRCVGRQKCDFFHAEVIWHNVIGARRPGGRFAPMGINSKGCALPQPRFNKVILIHWRYRQLSRHCEGEGGRTSHWEATQPRIFIGDYYLYQTKL